MKGQAQRCRRANSNLPWRVQSQRPSSHIQPFGRSTQRPAVQAACSRGGSIYLPSSQTYWSRSQPQCPGTHTIRGPGGGGRVSTRGAGGGVGAMIVVDTVLPALGAGISVVIVRFSIVVVVEVWAKAGAVNSRTAQTSTTTTIEKRT